MHFSSRLSTGTRNNAMPYRLTMTKSDSMCWYCHHHCCCCCCCHTVPAAAGYLYIFEDDNLFEILISGCKPISRRWKTCNGRRMRMRVESSHTISNGQWASHSENMVHTSKTAHTTHHLLMHYVSGCSVIVFHFIVRISQRIHFLCIFPVVYLHIHTRRIT